MVSLSHQLHRREEMIAILLLSGISFFGLPWVSGSVEYIAVWPGQNITLFCDCALSVGTLVAWFRNCSHVNQPSLVLRLKKEYSPHMPKDELMSPLPRFHFVKNMSSNSYNLLITNVTESDEGLYFCGTDTQKPGETEYITPTHVYSYGKAATRIKMMSHISSNPQPNQNDCEACWTLLYSLCPSVALLSSLITLGVVCYQNDKKARIQISDVTAAKRETDEDVCYAALEIRPVEGPKKTSYSSDFCTYSAVKSSRV